MDEFGRQLKRSLSKTTFRKERFTERQKNKIRQSISETEKYDKKPNPLIPRLLTAISVMILGLLLIQLTSTIVDDNQSASSEHKPTLDEINLKGEIENLEQEIIRFQDENHLLLGYVYGLEDPWEETELLYREKLDDTYVVVYSDFGITLSIKRKEDPRPILVPLEQEFIEPAGFSWTNGGEQALGVDMTAGLIEEESISDIIIKSNGIEQDVYMREMSNGQRFWFSWFDNDVDPKEADYEFSIEVINNEGEVVFTESY
ncbi:hypothetical protein [Alkalihalobacillus pseudalcaliphilus]|uniref:hypothetical protein n=1 Tax=Alkalihalobacillus pseudalcaliphilus TaxID=79884 RepID=UPI00064D78E5|nr:hypothetical protein [Alkalihalobacillus pseudalcaliphilus]KMK75840.1 hypothetical protein AB990_11290 [Alkalihalobacillus pseudalcaliphilus]